MSITNNINCQQTLLFSLYVVSDSLQPRGLQSTRLLCPWDSPGKNIGVGFHALLQGIFPTQGSNLHFLGLLHCRWILYHIATREAQAFLSLFQIFGTKLSIQFIGFPGGTVVKNLPVNVQDIRNLGSVPGWGRSSGRGHGNPLQYSCLENPMDRGTQWATVNGVAKNQT